MNKLRTGSKKDFMRGLIREFVSARLMKVMGWYMKRFVPIKGPNQWGDYTGYRQSDRVYLYRAIRSGGQDYFTFSVDRLFFRLSGEWGDLDEEFEPFDLLSVKWKVVNFYDCVRLVALRIIYGLRDEQASEDSYQHHGSHQDMDWITYGPIRLCVTDSFTLDHSHVELRLTVGPTSAQLRVGYCWAAGEDAIYPTGFFCEFDRMARVRFRPSRKRSIK
jgi:hypothetical protein